MPDIFKVEDPSLVRGFIAGVAGGLVASFVMNQFIAGTTKAKEALQSPAVHAKAKAQKATAGDDSTMKVADAVSTAATGEHLTADEKKAGGPVVHYVFGGLMGGVYGAAVEYMPAARVGAGAAFGSALFLGADEVMVPLLGLTKPPTEQPASDQAGHWAAHLVYGATVELVRRGLRKIV